MDGELAGGNLNAVRRVGDTVLRIAGPWTPTIHRYLRHLAEAGVDWIPRPLGIERDREVLSYVRGEVPVYPLPAWIWSDELLIDAARHLRALHDASVGFGTEGGFGTERGFGTEGAVWQLPVHEPVEVICHNDFAPHNLAFVDGAIAGVIDFDTSSPGPRIWDIAYLATRIVPLTRDHPDGSPGEDRSERRIQLLLDSYGSPATVAEVVRVAIVRLRELAIFSRAKADELDKPNLRADAAGYDRDADHLERVLVTPQ